MSEVVEAVAKAICDWQEQGKYDALADKSSYDSIGLHQEHWQIMARAALTVALDMMRKPSEGMLIEGAWHFGDAMKQLPSDDYHDKKAAECWQAMHDQRCKEILDD